MMKHSPNAEAIRAFYHNFDRRDAEGMASLYAADVVFSDPVFPALRGDDARAMWRMLCARGTGLRIELVAFEADELRGRARWDAFYTFSATGRPVHNRIDARFEFRDGEVVRHIDSFSFWRWSRQALGATGMLLGWTGLVRAKVQRTAARGLEEFKRR